MASRTFRDRYRAGIGPTFVGDRYGEWRITELVTIAPVIEIRLLGSPEIRRDGAVVQPDTRKALAVAARLALSDGPVSRDTLAALLWPDSEEAKARSSLRRTLSSLRSVVGGDALRADRQNVRFGLDSIWIDVVELESSFQATKEHGHPEADLCDRCFSHLDGVVDLYQGDFLSGFSLRGSPEFETWVTTMAEHYRRLAASALERLAAGRAARGEYSIAVAAARRWLEVDPIHEPAHRYLMLLHAWMGDRAGAIETYRECVRLLRVELGVAPLEETTELYEAILDEDLPRAPAARRRIEVVEAAHPPPPPSLIGRDPEWQALTSRLEEAEAKGNVVAIFGEAGMGKTRLLEEMAKGADGRISSLARAYPGERAIPYGVVAQLVEGAITSLAVPAIQALPDWVLGTTARLVPPVGELRPGISIDVSPPDQTSARRFVDGLERLLAACGQANGPGLLLVDDAQWLDTASAAFLAYLVRRISAHRLLLVLTFRQEEPWEESLLISAVQDGELTGDITRIELGPLQPEDVALLIKETGSSLGANEVWRRSGGVPLFVIEHLEAGNPEGIPDRVHRALAARLVGVSELARQVLTAAAVLEGMIDIDVLRRVAGRGEEETVEALDELFRKRLLRELPASEEVEFVHPPMVEVAYREASLARRRLLHRRAAEALESFAQRSARAAAAVARHLRLAGDDAAAAFASAHAGDLAREVFAHAEASEHYRNAIALHHPEPASLHLALGDNAVATGAYGEALREYETAAALGEGPMAATADHRLGEVHRRLGHLEVAEELFGRSELYHSDPAALYADWSLLARRRGFEEEAQRLAGKAMAAAEQSGDSARLARALDIVGILARDPDEAVGYLERSLALSGEDPVLRTAALNNLSIVVERAGDRSRALQLAHEALELATRSGDRHRQAALHNRLADIHHADGDEEASRRALTEAVRLFKEVGSEPGTWEPEVWLLTQW